MYKNIVEGGGVAQEKERGRGEGGKGWLWPTGQRELDSRATTVARPMSLVCVRLQPS